ncbi:MAG: DNA replication and repair protein RecF [Candidatus Cloacimonetes bacterium]|nr:DNA replication and repair protein RecF [Candidatus Cloacimonadota bacterium]
MRIIELNLENYRNNLNLSINFQPEGALLFGPNGIGKTNLLEAISYIAFGKSILGLRDNELINFSETFFRITASVEIKSQIFHIEAAADKTKKVIKIEKNLISKTSILYNYLKVIYFSPLDIEIIQGSPGKRRQFLDSSISQLKLEYLEILQRFYRILKQRNSLLKDKTNLSSKESWDKKYIEISSIIIKYRIIFLKEFAQFVKEKYHLISQRKENIEIKYRYSFPLLSDLDYFENLTNTIDKNAKYEIKSERSMYGPHLDDLEIKINDHDIRKFGSQGQKRSLSIALKLAQSQMMRENNECHPILIFDDVFADLDEDRTTQIINLLENKHQIFIATPNISQYNQINLPRIDVERFINSE